MLGFSHVLKSMKHRICLIDKGKNGHNEFTTGAKIPFSEKKKRILGFDSFSEKKKDFVV